MGAAAAGGRTQAKRPDEWSTVAPAAAIATTAPERSRPSSAHAARRARQASDDAEPMGLGSTEWEQIGSNSAR
jgi:hypothetical protein